MIKTISLTIVLILLLFASGCGGEDSLQQSGTGLVSSQSSSSTVSPSRAEQTPAITSPSLTTSPTPSISSMSLSSDDILRIMTEIEATQTYEARENLIARYQIADYQIYASTDVYNHVQSMVFSESVAINGLHNGLSPAAILKACPETLLIDYQDIYLLELNEICRQLHDYIQSPDKSGILVIVPFEGISMVGTAPNRQSPMSKMVVLRNLPSEDAQRILMSYIYENRLPDGLYLSRTAFASDSVLAPYQIDLLKKTVSHGEIVLHTFSVDRLTYRVTAGSGFLDRAEGMLDTDHYSDPAQWERQFEHQHQAYPVDNYLKFSIGDQTVELICQLTQEQVSVPVPERLAANLRRYLTCFDVNQLFSLGKESEKDDGEQVYALKAMFGRKANYWGGLSARTWFDIASLTVVYDAASGLPTRIVVRPKYSLQEAGEVKALTLSDLRVGPAASAMKTEQFLENILQEGAAETEWNRLKDFFDKTDFGSFSYNGITAQYHGLADCMTSIDYLGSPQNYETPRGITVGSTREEVQEAYGPSDVGLYESDAWFYLLDKPYWMTDEDHAKEPGKHYGDGLTFTFRDDRVIAIHCMLFISGS